ncbi:hypothetical protein [Campylobacter sp.]|uniref:hypothetical protein n=1 Tax=Campylobacter sp. TaxID=205 RepID=UPI002AA818DF|nr:hypothetical protein [Campylobacter sp.]
MAGDFLLFSGRAVCLLCYFRATKMLKHQRKPYKTTTKRHKTNVVCALSLAFAIMLAKTRVYEVKNEN